MGKWIKEINGLVWTLAGTGMVLITLSGKTLKWGIWITVAGLLLHFVTSKFNGDSE